MSNAFKHFSGNQTLEVVPVGSGVAIAIGDHLKLDGGKATPVTATTDNLAFIGYATEAHRTTDPSMGIVVATPNLDELAVVDLDAATDIAWGDALQLNSTQKLKKSTTDPVATAAESKLAATSIIVKYRVPNVAATFGQSATPRNSSVIQIKGGE